MTDKINQLIEENNRLKELQQNKTPEIVVSLNDNRGLIITDFSSFSGIKMDIEELSMDDVPDYLQCEITEEMITEYNDNLPDVDEREQYIKSSVLYKQLTNTGLDLDISVVNEGNAKANDICVDISFPKELLIKEIGEIDRLTEPECPKLPRNPIKTAGNEKFKKLHPNLSAVASFAQSLNNMDRFFSPPIVSSRLSSGINNDCFVSDDEIAIRLDNLLHTRMRTFNNRFRIIPLKRRKYELIINIICVEYDQNIEYTTPVTVI